MGCQVPCPNSLLLYNYTNYPILKHPSPCLQFPPNSLLRQTLSISCNNLNNQRLATTQTQTPQHSKTYSVQFKSLRSCKLGISRYPDFDYNAQGGAGSGMGTKTGSKGEVLVQFDAQELFIPPLSFATTKFLGLPLPPFLKIDIVPEAFHGIIDRESGKVELNFRAEFWFSVGSVYKAPPLLVETVLTSEESKGRMRGGQGERLNSDGVCRLVGVATVEPINDVFMDTFLGLPTECLADLSAAISFSDM